MNKKFIIIPSVLLVILIIFVWIRNMGNIHVTAEFLEMEPFYKNVDVYYKGFKLGRTTKIYPANDYSDTKVDIVLRVKENILPSNVIAKLKNKGGKDYIDLIFPSEPSEEYLQDNTTISGEKALNISSYIDNEAENGGLDEIKDNLNDTIKTAGVTLDALSDLFVTLESLIKDIKPSLEVTSKNLEDMSYNLSGVTKDLKVAVNSNRFDNMFQNIENATANINRSTQNLEVASKNISNITNHANKETISILDCVLKNLNRVVLNIDKIVLGIKNTLSKRFSGMNIMFGKAIK